VPRDRLEVIVVGRGGNALAELAQEVDEAQPRPNRREVHLRVARAAAPVVDGKQAYTPATK
jgi:hypothetical protein